MLRQVLTDLDLQFMWVQSVDRLFVPREDARRMLEAYVASGAPPIPSVTVSGIPVHPTFTAKAQDACAPSSIERRATRRADLSRLCAMDTPATAPADWPAGRPWPPPSWPPSWPPAAAEDGDEPGAEGGAEARPIVVFMSSGNAVVHTYEGLLACETPLRLVVVTGRQADVRGELQRLHVPPRHAVKLLGFVTEMASLLRCADLLVSKSGGLSIAEAAALGVPMVVLDPIPGQEQRNADVLLEAGAALKVNDLPLLPRKVDAILADGGAKRVAMAKAMAAIGKPDAAFVVADAVLRGELRPRATSLAKLPVGRPPA